MPTPLQRLKRALATRDPVSRLSALVNSEVGHGATFNWAHACLLETNSAGLSILLDRFNGRELRRIEKALQAVGAKNALKDLRRLRRAPQKAAEVDRRRDAQVAELRAALLRFARGNLDALAADMTDADAAVSDWIEKVLKSAR